MSTSLSGSYFFQVAVFSKSFMVLANITVQLYIVRNPSILGNESFDQKVNIGFGSVPVVTAVITLTSALSYPKHHDASYTWLRGAADEFNPMMVVKTLISMVPFFLVFVFRTFIRIVFALQNFFAFIHM